MLEAAAAVLVAASRRLNHAVQADEVTDDDPARPRRSRSSTVAPNTSVPTGRSSRCRTPRRTSGSTSKRANAQVCPRRPASCGDAVPALDRPSGAGWSRRRSDPSAVSWPSLFTASRRGTTRRG
jgi:hypothetical protein